MTTFINSQLIFINKFLNHNHILKRLASSRPKFTAVLNKEIEDEFESGIKHRQHPGRRNVTCVELPYKLEMAALKVLNKYNSTLFKEEITSMMNFMHERQLPKEASFIREKAKQLKHQVSLADGININNLPEEERELVKEKRLKQVESRLKALGCYYKPVDYNNYNSAIYLGARLAANYAALIAVFKEIQKDDPNFKPQTLFDFGSGLGTSMWAANEIWTKSFNEYFCVDISGEMNDLSRLLLQQGDEEKSMSLDGVFYRQFLPASHTIKYDLVVSAFSLLELPDYRNRIQVIENLWHKTQDVLVIIEHGTRSGFEAVLEARNFILEISGHKVTPTFKDDIADTNVTVKDTSQGAHILAPCSHTLSCPRQVENGQLCKFEVKYNPLNYGQPNYKAMREQYSYVVLRKGENEQYEFTSWPRIVEPVIKHSGMAICRMCCSDGRLHEVIFTKSKHPKHVFRCARISKWGDLLPASVFLRDPHDRNGKK